MKTLGMKIKAAILLMLALVMLATVGFTAVAAVDAAESSETGTGAYPDNTGKGEEITGWLDVTYGADGITVTLTPDVEALKGINREQIESLAKTLIAAIEEVVVKDITGDLLGTDIDFNVDLMRLVTAYGIPGYRAATTEEALDMMKTCFDTPGPTLLECLVDPDFMYI